MIAELEIEKGAAMRLADTFVAEMEQEAQTTKRVLERIPEGKLSWRPHPKSFSLGQLGLHIAAVPGALATAIVPDTREVPQFNQAEAKSQQEIMETFSSSLATAKEALKNMDDAKLTAPWSLVRNGKTVLSMSRAVVVRSIMMNHIYHHRGQLSVYLRILSVPLPSIYGPSADEDPFG
jgi:uncharacterized damage-inducible protein DinB